MDPPALGALERLGRALDVAGRRAGERRDHRAAHGVGDLPDRVELARRGDREPRLDDVDVQSGELLGDLELLRLGQRDARRLFAVAQGRVEDPYHFRADYRFAT